MFLNFPIFATNLWNKSVEESNLWKNPSHGYTHSKFTELGSTAKQQNAVLSGLGMENTWKENMEEVREQRKVEGEKKGKGDEE